MDNRQFKFGKHKIQGDDFLLIAEIGNNHNGSVDLCCKMMSKAVECGAHLVKLQKRNIDTFWSKDVLEMPYINPNSYGKTYREHKKALEFGKKQWEILVRYAKKNKITLFSTAFDEESVDFLENYDLIGYKVASAGHTDMELINKLADTNKPLIISVGGSTWHQLDELYYYLSKYKHLPTNQYAFLHCTMEYPPPAEHMNLRVIEKMQKIYSDTVIGLSDHYIHSGDSGIMAYASYAIGARIFEKHFTFNHAWKGPDHRISLDPDEFAALRHGLDRLKAAMGNGEKVILPQEKGNIEKMKKYRG